MSNTDYSRKVFMLLSISELPNCSMYSHKASCAKHKKKLLQFQLKQIRNCEAELYNHSAATNGDK